MEHLEPIIKTIALTMGVAWASGINLYAAILVLGILGSTGHITLPPELIILSDPLIITAAGVMYAVEFFADKIPGVDNGWDTIHSFIRIPAGALLAAAAVGEVHPSVAITAALLGGGMAASTHAAKSGTRVLINASPEPVTNWITSLGEDAAVIIGLWTALHYPLVFVGFLVFFILLLVWLLPKIWKGVMKMLAMLRTLFRQQQDTGQKNKLPSK
ncbi:MAG: hypothetical protein AMJ61_02575 [Desulfobacterales bacterium SG8_35_2]|nr:MAG: hypothetical protein AMJ61_02575 [Desulfobacterales bacterium SG8_35_2]